MQVLSPVEFVCFFGESAFASELKSGWCKDVANLMTPAGVGIVLQEPSEETVTLPRQ